MLSINISKCVYPRSTLTSVIYCNGQRFGRVQMFSSQSENKPGFFGKFLNNVKQEFAKNKEMRENLKKFREEAEKLERSEALQKARQKYQVVENEASRSSEVLKDRFDLFKGKVQGVIKEASKSDIVKKAGHLKEELSKSAKDAADKLSESSSKIGKTSAFRTISEKAQSVQKEIDTSSFGGRVYRAPTQLRRRIDVTFGEAKVAPNLEATGVELHKDSKFFESWKNFKDNNEYVNKIMDWKQRYDESNNPMARASRFLADKFTDVCSGIFQSTELSETLTQICKLDPSFEKEEFLKFCEQDIIPNVLEAMIRGDLEILKDWCHEAPYSVLAAPIQQALQHNYRFDSKVIDVDKIDLMAGKMMEFGPVLVVNFEAQQIMCVRDAAGRVVEGDPNKVLRVTYVWALCRDASELNPKAAWRLLDMSANSNEQPF